MENFTSEVARQEKGLHAIALEMQKQNDTLKGIEASLEVMTRMLERIAMALEKRDG